MKKRIIIIGLALLLLAVGNVTGNVIRQRKETKREEAWRKFEITALIGDVAAEADVSVKNHEIVLENLVFNEKELFMRIAYFNYLTDSNLTLEQIEEQVENLKMTEGGIVFNENILSRKIVTYNYVTGSNLTLEQIEKHIENLKMAEGNTEELDEFCQFVEDNNIRQSGAWSDYDNFRFEVDKELGDNIDYLDDDITLEQLEETCQTVTERMEQESR